MTRSVFKIAAMMLAFGLVPYVSAQDEPAQSESAPPVGAEYLSDEEAESLIEDIKQSVVDAEAELQNLSRSDHFDIGVVVEGNDFDPFQLLDWVTTETRWTPYPGLLRGSDGVLMDRRGNSLDRSLLLSELLETAGFDTRLARTTLGAEQARAVFLAQTHAAAGSRSTRRSEVAQPPANTGRFVDQVGKLTAVLTRMLDGQLGTSDGSGPIEEPLDHWWVQARLDSGWVDFDPLRHGVEAPAIEAETFWDAGELPAELEHRVEIRMVIESFSGGKLNEAIPISVSLRATEIPTGTFLEIGILPYSADWGQNDESGGLMSGSEVATTAEFWLPVLKLDGKTEFGDWFSKEGLIADSPFSYVGKRKMSAATSALGELGGEDDAARTAEQILTAVWLEYAVHRPGMEPDVTRREIIDLLGSQNRSDPSPEFSLDDEALLRRGLALQMKTHVLPLTRSPAPVAVQHSALDFWVRNRNPFIAMVYWAAGREDERIEPALGQLHFRPVDLMGIAAMRQQISPYADRIYLDRINLLSNHFFPATNQNAASENFGIDIVFNHVGVLPGEDMSPSTVRIAQGIIDTYIETVVLESDTAFNTFQLSLDQAIGLDQWIPVLQPADITNLSGLPADSMGRIMQSLENGAVALVLPRPVEYGEEAFASWWEVDAANGTTMGRGFRGWGTQLTEQTVKNIVVPTAVRKVAQKQGAALACKMAIVATTVAERVVVAELHAAGKAKLPVRKFQRACYVLK